VTRVTPPVTSRDPARDPTRVAREATGEVTREVAGDPVSGPRPGGGSRQARAVREDPTAASRDGSIYVSRASERSRPS